VPKLVKFCKKAGDLRTRIIDKLVEKAKGMSVYHFPVFMARKSLTGFRFLLVNCTFESLKTKTDVKALRKALDVLPKNEIRYIKRLWREFEGSPQTNGAASEKREGLPGFITGEICRAAER